MVNFGKTYDPGGKQTISSAAITRFGYNTLLQLTATGHQLRALKIAEKPDRCAKTFTTT